MKLLLTLLCLMIISLTLSLKSKNGKKRKKKPNFIIILADDLGYNDIGINGSPTILTPTLDRLSYEG